MFRSAFCDNEAELSMFYGIVVRMDFFDDMGELPSGKARLVQAWIEIHRDELLAIGSWR